ncbi:MAG: hypothetical protein DMG06_20360 [Acidobacteria bacterium]|nr:MAG: hypothetical protein DMG06_20360 [Acidobacteriota bacterium]
MDVDQELTNLEDGIRRLKIEYEIFFNGGTSRMPFDLRWRVETLIKKYNDFGKMTFAQRFRYTTLVSKFHSYSDLWRRMIKSKEEGRPAFPTLPASDVDSPDQTQTSGDRVICQLICSDPELEAEKFQNLFKSLIEAKRECGEKPETVQFQSFKKYLAEKTSKLKDQFKCDSVCYIVSIESGKVKFTAKGGI